MVMNKGYSVPRYGPRYGKYSTKPHRGLERCPVSEEPLDFPFRHVYPGSEWTIYCPVCGMMVFVRYTDEMPQHFVDMDVFSAIRSVIYAENRPVRI